MKFIATITGWYEVSDDEVEETYGTTDPNECAKFDESLSPEELVSYLSDVIIDINAIDEGPSLTVVKDES